MEMDIDWVYWGQIVEDNWMQQIILHEYGRKYTSVWSGLG